jgi:uncharacterized repeat protein (TIGR03803 family)
MKPNCVIQFVSALACAVVLCASSAAAKETVLHRFGKPKDGAHPQSGVINQKAHDPPVNGDPLLGTTAGGGSSGQGTVFSISLTGIESVLYSFKGGTDGAIPVADLLDTGSFLYGTTTRGGGQGCGGQGCGTVFSINLATGAEGVLYSFKGGTDGSIPVAGLLDTGSYLYGTTMRGGGQGCGGQGCGTVFSINLATGTVGVLYAFKGGTDGSEPEASLTSVGNNLYVTTARGGGQGCGGQGCGTVFSINLATGAVGVLHSFKGGTDGAVPVADLLDVGGNLYGTTTQGGGLGCGGQGCGTVFSINPASGAVRVLYSFKGGADGTHPRAGLLDVGGNFYGTTAQGGGQACGGQGCGAAFSINPATGAEGVLYAFQGGTDGAVPVAGLLDAGGYLFGTTARGGGQGCAGLGCGTVFDLTLP